MKSKLIVMLTQNDQTSKDAIPIFHECQDLPIDYWGFKNVGISETEMCELINAMKKAGKKTFLEVVTYTKESCMSAAKFACKHKFDFLLGTLFYPDVWNYLKTEEIQYYPFIGNVFDSPSSLSGSSEDMINESDRFFTEGIPGIDVLAFRYINGNPIHLAQKIVKNTKLRVILAGSINSVERINAVNSINPWGFTIGSALFTQNFVKGGGFRENLEKVLEIMNVLNNKS